MRLNFVKFEIRYFGMKMIDFIKVAECQISSSSSRKNPPTKIANLQRSNYSFVYIIVEISSVHQNCFFQKKITNFVKIIKSQNYVKFFCTLRFYSLPNVSLASSRSVLQWMSGNVTSSIHNIPSAELLTHCNIGTTKPVLFCINWGLG